MLAKFQSPDVRRNFKKKGINVEKLIERTKKEGGDIMETIYAALMKATKGDPGKAINFFGDEQARAAAVALMQNIEKYREMRDRYNGITAPDKLNADLARREGGAGNTYRTFGERWTALMTAIGKGVNEWLAPAVDFFGKLADHITRAAEAMPKLAGALALAGAAWAGFSAFKAVTGLLSSIGGAGASGAAAASGGGAAATVGATAATAGRFGLMRMLGIPALAAYGLNVADPKGNLWGLTSGIDEWVKKRFGVDPTNIPLPEITKAPKVDPAKWLELQKKLSRMDQSIADVESGKKPTAIPLDTLRGARAAVKSQIDSIEAEMGKVDGMTATPKINVFEIERALKLLQDLQGAIRGVGAPSPSFMDNAAPSPKAGGDRQSSAPSNRTYNVSGYSPAVVARRIAREERRAARETQYGALHDLGALA
jgi:hypothetical protein